MLGGIAPQKVDSGFRTGSARLFVRCLFSTSKVALRPRVSHHILTLLDSVLHLCKYFCIPHTNLVPEAVCLCLVCVICVKVGECEKLLEVNNLD